MPKQVLTMSTLSRSQEEKESGIGPYEAYQNGDLEPSKAIRALWSDLREVESDLAPLEAQRSALRDQIGEIVARNGPINLSGLGSAAITNPSVTITYDRARVERLLTELAQTHPELAARLAACRVETSRAGSLRLTSEKVRG